MTDEKGVIILDLGRLIRALWQKKILIIVCSVICGAAAFMYSSFVMVPQYRSTAMLFVNNVKGNQATVTSSELSAARSLLDVYIVILKSPDTLETVIEETGINYSVSKLKSVISAESVNETEVFEIKVETDDPETSKKIVDSLVGILPSRISEIIDGSSVKVVSAAKLPTSKSSPNTTKYLITGLLVGFFVACAGVCLGEALDTTVHDEDYLNGKYDIPVLAVVPDMRNKSSRRYGYEKK